MNYTYSLDERFWAYVYYSPPGEVTELNPWIQKSKGFKNKKAAILWAVNTFRKVINPASASVVDEDLDKTIWDINGKIKSEGQ